MIYSTLLNIKESENLHGDGMTLAHSSQQAERAAVDEIERAIMQVSWLAQRQFMQLLDEDRFRLTLPQFYTLIHLHQMGEECKMSDLAEATHQSAASLTGVVDRLLEKQLVERTRHERDRRQVMVVVTQRGGELIGEIKQARREQMQSALAQLGEQEVEAFQRTLDQVIAGMVRVLERGEGGRLA
jgi:DNA-binding MarR family transcriptional regulator